jgi:diadenosine tetraphosphate (Ap4A) HIT family hydrolase
MAEIHPQLLNDCLVIGRFTLCHLLLVKDANYPWFILVPDRDGIQEVYQLSEQDQIQLISESSTLSQRLMKIFNGDKFNVAALGNQVPQLHLHHIVRYQGDPAWPGPIWGKVPARAYSEDELDEIVGKLKLDGLIGK